MQIFAFDIQGNLLSAIEAERKKDYICPECHQSVRLRGGYQRRAHFYHPKKTTCCLSKKSYLHLSIQLHLAHLLPLEECHLEKSFSSLRRRADCVWESKKIIFEIQCSPLSQEEILNRINDYRSYGYTVVWILSDQTFSPEGFSSIPFFLKKFTHYYTNIDLDGKGIIYDHYENQKIPIDLSKPIFPPYKNQIELHNKFRKKWPVIFEGTSLKIVFYQRKKEWFIKRFLRSLAFFLLSS